MLPTLLLLASLTPSVVLTQTRVSAPTIREALVPVAPGESLRVTVAGAGETVVLVPGLFGSAFGYRHLLSMLPADGLRAVVIEPLGIGRSPRPRKADYTLTAQADRIAAAISQLHDRPVTIVAHSLGASMALRVAYRAPGRVRSIVLLDGGPAEEAGTRGLRRAMRYAPWIKWMGGVRRLRPQLRKDLIAASGDPSWVTDEVVDGYVAGAVDDLDGTLLALLAMAEAREPERLAPHLPEIRFPVRLVVGTARHEGGVEPKQVELMRKRLPNFAIETIPGAGQYLFEEQPAVVAAIIRRMARPPATSLGFTQP